MSKTIQEKKASVIPVESIVRRIYLIRGQKVMLDADLAEFYGVTTKYLNRAVFRNVGRFPQDFMFQLSREEYQSLRCQFGTSKIGRGGRRYYPFVFTEHGVMMLSSVLRSERAIQMNIFIVRAFIRIRELLVSNKELAYEVDKLKQEQKLQNRHINALYSILGKLIEEPVKKREPMGFRHSP
ncbi:ORF6N domain-containing protein [Patescibacteria group bacterium]|nr:ORF6N domain-containing protein [Patescibacteria group bacterium]MDE1946771.1 ORF6N domain-containing protein [Patescibacteria group bacterium]MDE2011097.1 ORF6N domain-containing protein [Patescibacteria group bacterium]MDE2233597.1 ORF6N domain-containing protein [Patescibacteria group bacterium]